jgi:hypothetical protein
MTSPSPHPTAATPAALGLAGIARRSPAAASLAPRAGSPCRSRRERPTRSGPCHYKVSGAIVEKRVSPTDTIAVQSLAGHRAVPRFAGAANFFVHAADSVLAGFPLALTAFACAAPVFALRKFGRQLCDQGAPPSMFEPLEYIWHIPSPLSGYCCSRLPRRITALHTYFTHASQKPRSQSQAAAALFPGADPQAARRWHWR